jgi:adenine C2-methylase RlmN of 23S rRNA A2503 and tRNA A37
MNFDYLKKFAKKENLPGYRVAQMRQALFEKGISSWQDASVLPKELRDKLDAEQPILSFKQVDLLRSRGGEAFKALLELHDGTRIESVLLRPMRGHWSVCVSTQVGCKVHCAICATGKMKFKRNLSAEEIADQALFWHQFLHREALGERLSSIVFMGMGEPMHNYAAVVKAVNDLSDKDNLNIGQRHISISTSGHAGAILALAQDLPQVNLAVSLHSADEEERDRLVPMNIDYGLDELAKALTKYLKKTKRQVFLEYAVIPGVNNTPHHLRLLFKWLRGIEGNYLLHVNVIPYNNPAGKTPPDDEAAKAFAAALAGMGVPATVRKSLGGDIKGACGQLAAGN